MPPLLQPHGTPWYATARFRTIALVVFLVLLGIQAPVAVFCRDGDFEWHRWVGGEFLEGTVYGGTNINYPVSRALMDAPLAVAPYRLTRALFFVLALGALYACYRTWRRLAEAAAPAPAGVTTAATALTGLLLLSFLLRDLDECGLQLFLLFFLSMGLSALTAGRPARAGFWLATAAIYKLTPILCLPFLLWKRQWRAAGWMVVFVGLWVAAPVPFVGIGPTLQAQRDWLAYARRVMARREAYPNPLIEPAQLYNFSLQAALARNLETYPPGHRLYVDHPLCVQPGSFDPETAYLIVRTVLVVLALVLAWCFRRRWDESRRPGQPAGEWAAVCVLCALVSPLCWKQHLVLVLPAAFLVVRATLAVRPTPRWRVAVLLVAGAVFNLTRHSLAGSQLAAVFLSYKFDTWAVLFLMGMLLARPPGAAASRAGETGAGPAASRAA